MESAALAKDIAAFANSRDGGVLVIGKSEPDPGRFELTGLSDDQADSFDTTKAARWINGRFAPPIDVVCHQHQRDGRRFVVITVAEFADVPILCTKSFQHPDRPKEHLLRERTIYVRNSNAESAPLESVEELRTLIGLATAKRGNEMLAMFESMLKGQPLLGAASDDEQFDEELKRIEEGLGQPYADQLRTGAWRLVVRPTQYEAERWTEADQLEDIIRRRSVRLTNEFPASWTGTHMREWGLCNDTYRYIWTLARSGQFLCVRPYWENEQRYEPPGVSSPPEPRREPGQWLDFKPNIRSIFEMLMFVARLLQEYEAGEQTHIALQATALRGRTLVTTDFGINIRPIDDGHCRADVFEFEKTLSIEAFRAEWESHCADAMKRFLDLFPGERAPLKTMTDWIERFKSRRF